MGKELILRGCSSKVKVFSEWEVPEHLVSRKLGLNIPSQPRGVFFFDYLGIFSPNFKNKLCICQVHIRSFYLVEPPNPRKLTTPIPAATSNTPTINALVIGSPSKK